MAFQQHCLWLLIFRVPADGYAHRHVMQLNGVNDQAEIKKALYRMNPDMRVDELRPLRDYEEMVDVTAKTMQDGGPSYRSLQRDEHLLTVRQVQKLHKQLGIEAPGLTAPPEPKTLEERAAYAAADARGDLQI